MLGVVLAASLIVLAGCDPVIGQASGPVRRATVTSKWGMTYHYAGGRDVVFAQRPAHPDDGNVREVFWYDDAAYAADQEVCATWNTVAAVPSTGLLQPGLALRIAPVTGDNRGIKAVTVTQNIYYGAIWLFNVHVWNSLSALPDTQIAQYDFSEVVGSLLRNGRFDPHMAPVPWHVCARATDRLFSFKIWVGSEPEPAWNDPVRSRSLTLPAGWNHPGYAGGYMAHLHRGQAAAFTDVRTRTLP